jgi:hypothetical protein
MTTCSVPFYGEAGDTRRLKGIVTADVSLDSLTKVVSSVRILETGTICRECLDYLIPLGERHLRGILAEWIAHFNAVPSTTIREPPESRHPPSSA